MKTLNYPRRHKGMHKPRRARAQGFTLLELMITVAIVAILAAIAYASYESSIVKSRRAAAANCLQERAQFMERYYTTNMSYLNAPLTQCGAEVSPHYTLSYAAAPTATAYTINATPQGRQAVADAQCGTLTINQQGVRGSAGTEVDCW